MDTVEAVTPVYPQRRADPPVRLSTGHPDDVPKAFAGDGRQKPT
jgi:hypothetical protein